MTVVGVLSVKHAPGATTAAAAIATASATDAVVVECDPAGGDIAARGHLAVEPGLVSLAAAGRHPTSHLDLLGHSQHLPTGVPVVVAPTAPDQARSEEHTSELQSLMRISYAVFFLKKQNKTK